MGFPVSARCVALPASAAVALALTGCASGGSPSSTASYKGSKGTQLELIKAAYATTTAAKSARVFMKIDDPETDQGKYPEDGVDDFQHQRSEHTFWDGQATVESRQIGTKVYMHYVKAPAGMPGVLGTTKPWARMPIADNDPSASRYGVDDAAFLGLLRGATSPIAEIGTDNVRGQRSTHYHVTVDKLLAGANNAPDSVCGKSATSDSTMPIDVWLDGQGRLTRMQIHIFTDNQVPPGFPAPQPQLTPETIVITLEFYDFDVPVSISAPPAQDTQTITMPPVPNTHGTATPYPCPTS